MSGWHDEYSDDDGIAEAEDLLLQAQMQLKNNPKATGHIDTKRAQEPSVATSVRKKKEATRALASGGKTATRGKVGNHSSTEDASNRGPSSQIASTESTTSPLSKHTPSADGIAITKGSSTNAMSLTRGSASEPNDVTVEEKRRVIGGCQATSQIAHASSGAVQSRNSIPGAHMVLGPDGYFEDSHDDDVVEEGTDADLEQFRDEEIRIEASLVKDIDDKDLTGLLILPATRDPWWRRNQMWIGAGILVVIMAIVLSVTLTAIDLSPPPDAPTMSPTTELTGLEDDTKSIIIDIFPSAMTAIEDEGSIQARSFEWILKQRDAGQMVDGAATNLTVRQQYSLVTLYLSTGGPSNWTVKDSWMNATTDECAWHGVVCKDQVVTEIVLPQHGLVGTIPPEIALLAEGLTSIILSSNALTGSIPSEIGNLSLLSSLSLNDNLMSGPIPSSINSLISLAFLDLSLNRLVSSIPDSLSGLSALQVFDISKNRLVDVVPSEVGSLGMLEELYFGENKISFTLPSEIGTLENLRILSGGNNIIRGSLPTDIGLLRNLRVLDFWGNRLSGTVPGEFTSLRNLTILNLRDNLLQGSLPKSIGLLTKLEMLAVGNNLFSGDFPGTVRLIDTLKHLNISDNSWYGSVGNIIGRLTGLQTLAAARCGISWIQFDKGVLEARDLEVLDLSGNYWSISQNDFNQIFSSLPNLRELKLAGVISDALYIPSSVGLLSRLEIFDMEGSVSLVGVSTQLISAGGIVGTLPTEIGRLGNLTALNLGRNQMTGKISILSELLNVESIQLQGNLFSGSLPYLGDSTQLKIFDIHQNVDITGTFPAEVLELSNLEILKLGDTAISGSLPSRWGSLSQLQTLDLHDTLISGDVMGLTGLISLENVDLSNTLLTGNVTASVLAMSSLVRLSLAQSPGLFGTLTPAIGQLSKLVTMNVAQVNFTMSSLPSEIGQLSSLVMLNMQETGIQGTVPTELFHCYQLQVLSLAGNNQIHGSLGTAITQLINLSELDFSGTSINGTLPEGFGRLILLQSLDLSATKVASPLPSSFGQLDELNELSLRGAKGIVKFPTEIGSLISLKRLDVSESGIKNDTLPNTLENLSNLEYLNLQGTDISGTISQDSILCELTALVATPGDQHRSLQAYIGHREVHVDCDKVTCECCLCSTDSPSERPSLAPSESQVPSSSANPSQKPSGSTMPSQSEEPSVSAVDCEEFVSLSEIGAALPFSLQADEEILVVDLPIDFDWFDQTISSVGVLTNGALMIDPFDVDVFGYSIVPIEEVNVFMTVGARVAVAHADLLLRDDGQVYVAELEDSYVISWENMTFFGFEPPLTINFQTALHSNGNVEIRWGPGSLDGTGVQFVAGLQDIALGIAIPAEGDTFNPLGLSEFSSWPAMTCSMLSARSNGLASSPASTTLPLVATNSP